MPANPHCQQARHNESFYQTIDSTFKELYFDWKITCLFYCAYHLLKALAEVKGKNIGNRHTEILWNINPKNVNRILHLKNDVFYAFDGLFNYSWTARYDGFISFQDFQTLKKNDHAHALHQYTYFKKYVISQGVDF